MITNLDPIGIRAPRCALCGKPKLQPPDTANDWHTFASRCHLVAVCGDHFLPKISEGETFETCYARVLKALEIPL
jgi:hypothetical protein